MYIHQRTISGFVFFIFASISFFAMGMEEEGKQNIALQAIQYIINQPAANYGWKQNKLNILNNNIYLVINGEITIDSNNQFVGNSLEDQLKKSEKFFQDLDSIDETKLKTMNSGSLSCYYALIARTGDKEYFDKRKKFFETNRPNLSVNWANVCALASISITLSGGLYYHNKFGLLQEGYKALGIGCFALTLSSIALLAGYNKKELSLQKHQDHKKSLNNFITLYKSLSTKHIALHLLTKNEYNTKSLIQKMCEDNPKINFSVTDYFTKIEEVDPPDIIIQDDFITNNSLFGRIYSAICNWFWV